MSTFPHNKQQNTFLMDPVHIYIHMYVYICVYVALAPVGCCTVT